MISLIQITGIAASACTASSMLPQLIKIAREKKADAISLPMLGILFAGVALWVVYGFLRNDLIIIIANALSLVLNVLILILSLKYKKEDGAV